MRLYDENSKLMVDIPNDILLSLHSFVIEWANSLLRNHQFLVRNDRIYEVEFPYLSILFDKIFHNYLSADLTEFSKNLYAVKLTPTESLCVDEEEEVSEDAVRRAYRIYPYRKLPIVKPGIKIRRK